MQNMFKDKVLLITGGTGSFGNAVLDRFLDTYIGEICIFRHGEKLYESLVSREDMVKAEDMGDYFRIPADTRDLNYDLYFSDGEKKLTNASEYHSHNTEQMDIEATKKLLLKLEFISNDMEGRG